MRFDTRGMIWSDTAIVGSAMSDWDLAWKIVFLVINIISIPLFFYNPGLAMAHLVFALDAAVFALELAFDPDQVDVDLGFGEDPLYLISAKSVETLSRLYVETKLYVHNADTENWDLIENLDTTSGNIHGTSGLALTDRGLMMEVKDAGNRRVDYYFHTANGVFFSREELSGGADIVFDDRRHVDAGHDIIASTEWTDKANTIRLYRYFNRSWQGPVQSYRVKSVVTQDGYQTTKLSYRYHEGSTYPVRFDASAGMAFYNKVTELVEGSDSGSVETYSYNGFLLPPPNAPSSGNAADHTSAVIGATYCTLATGATGVVSTAKTLHQVYAQEKAGHTEYLVLEVGSISETDGVVTSQQVTYDVDVSGNPRESRSFVGQPDLSSEHQASRTTYAHEIPAYAGLRAKGFLDGPARSESEIRNGIPSEVSKQFTTRWGTIFYPNGSLDPTAPFQVARGTFKDQKQNRSFNLYKTTGVVTHVCSDFSDNGAIVNAGFVTSGLSGSAPVASTLVGPSGQFPAAVAGYVGRDSTGKGRVEFVYARNAGEMQIVSPTDLVDQPFPKIGLDQQTGSGGRSVFVSGRSKVYRYDIVANGTLAMSVTAAGQTDVGAPVQTSPAALRGGGAVVGLLMSPTTRGIGSYTVGHPTPVRWTRDLGPYSALTEINALSYDQANLSASWIIVGGIRGDLLDVIVLDGMDGTEKARLTGLAATGRRPSTRCSRGRKPPALSSSMFCKGRASRRFASLPARHPLSRWSTIPSSSASRSAPRSWTPTGSSISPSTRTGAGRSSPSGRTAGWREPTAWTRLKTRTRPLPPLSPWREARWPCSASPRPRGQSSPASTRSPRARPSRLRPPPGTRACCRRSRAMPGAAPAVRIFRVGRKPPVPTSGALRCGHFFRSRLGGSGRDPLDGRCHVQRAPWFRFPRPGGDLLVRQREAGDGVLHSVREI
jgi:hypothetical protein